MNRHSTPLVLRWLSAPVAAALVTAGLWITGGLITNDFAVAMWLTVAWMAAAGVTALVIAARTPAFRWPVLGAYAVVALAAGIYLGASIFIDSTVDEDVARAAPRAVATKAEHGRDRPQRPVNVALRSGAFEPVRHAAVGEATVIRLADGGRVVTLTDFEVDNGPDLRVYLVAGPATTESEVDDYLDLGALKGNIGDQQYEVPAGVDLSRYATVVVWCRAFSVLFARAATTN